MASSFNAPVDAEFFELAKSYGGFNSGPPEHQFEGRYRLQPGDTYVEAGAFWGRYGLIASHRVGPSGKVILIEPHPENIDMIERVIAHFSLTNVTLVKGGVWGFDAKLPFVFYGNPAGGRRAVDGDMDNYSEYILEVQVRSLDSLLKELKVDQIDLLACDVEGAEFEMVKGANNYLQHHKIRNVALAAYHGKTYAPDIMGFLSKKGYKDLEYHHSLPHYGGLVYGRAP